MKKSWAKRPSPALVISVIALFVALGGSAYAVNQVGTKDIKKNAVTTAKLKKNAVTTAKLKNNAVTTSKLKNNAVTGAKINESSLGVVPHAALADEATNFSRFFVTGLKKVGVGSTETLASIGPFTFIAKCEEFGGGGLRARTLVTTSEPNSFMYSYEGGDQYIRADFQPGVEAALGTPAENDQPEWAGLADWHLDWSVANADGSLIVRGLAESGVHVFGSDCAFNLSWTRMS